MPLKTPQQYCFPYFFDEQEFKKDIVKLGLLCKIEFDKEKGVYKPLQLFDNNGFELVVEYFFCLMVDSNNNLIIWRAEEDELVIYKVFSNGKQLSKKDFKIDLHNYEAGKYELDRDYELTHFITYIRKENRKN